MGLIGACERVGDGVNCGTYQGPGCLRFGAASRYAFTGPTPDLFVGEGGRRDRAGQPQDGQEGAC